jgi:hypothetical protein
VGLKSRVVPFATKIEGEPLGPKCLLKLSQSTPRRAYGDEAIMNNIHSLQGDRYAGAWPVEAFIRYNMSYEQSAAPKSDLYRDLVPFLNSQRIALLDHPKLIGQLTSLERRVARGGKDSIDHAPGAHDDIANAVAGLCAMLRETAEYDNWHAALWRT